MGAHASVQRLTADPFLTVKEVALVFRLCEKTIYRYVKDGTLPSIRTPGGGGIRIRQSDVTRLFVDEPVGE